MGFGFRKSFGSGPFRFTVSPRGFSSSFGIRGARISSGPRGTFVTVSSHGAYYRHRIDVPTQNRPQTTIPTQASEEAVLDSVFQVPVAELIASNQSELVEKLNANVTATNPAVLIGGFSLLGLFVLSSSPALAILIVSTGLVASMVVSHYFQISHTHPINYSLDENASRRFADVQHAVATLGACSSIWTLNTQTTTNDFKRNAGAKTLITRQPASIGTMSTKGFKTSIPISSISTNGTVFHFLPDQILIFSGGRYAAVDYTQLAIKVSSTRFIENGYVPQDSTQVDSTWLFVNKNGGPDRRFNGNRQLPILQYGEVTLRTTGGLSVTLQTSSYTKAVAFESQLRGGRPPADTSARQETGTPPRPTQSVLVSLSHSYEILGLRRPSTLEAAAVAHRQQAALYHPDKYEHLAPEMKSLASAKMQEINAAYSAVKLDISSS